MIRTFADKRTAAIFEGLEVRKLPKTIQDTARRKLKLIDATVSLDSLRVPPGNRLEALSKDLKASIASASTTSGGSAFAGKTAMHGM